MNFSKCLRTAEKTKDTAESCVTMKIARCKSSSKTVEVGLIVYLELPFAANITHANQGNSLRVVSIRPPHGITKPFFSLHDM